jgi:hypothetical protein
MITILPAADRRHNKRMGGANDAQSPLRVRSAAPDTRSRRPPHI